MGGKKKPTKKQEPEVIGKNKKKNKKGKKGK